MLSFVETMHGTLKDEAGREHPVGFEMRASGAGRGRFTLQGVIHAPPFTEEAVAEGTLVLGPRLRVLTYRLRFLSRDGRALQLDAEKRPSLLSPLRSMTAMPATIRDATGKVLSFGMMTFEKRDLPSFAASWLGLGARGKRLAERRQQLLAGA